MGNGKTRKKTPAGMMVLQGVLVSLGIYLLAAVGMLCWANGVTWTGRGGILLACVLGGGLLSALLGRRRGGRRVQKKLRRK